MSADPKRLLALRVMTRVRRDEAWIQAALQAESAGSALEDRDRAFVTALVRGAIEHAGSLDVMIDRAATRPSRIEPRVRDALRIATYEILYMGTPDRAAVNEGVELVRSVQPRAAGYSNAVLRRVAQLAPDFPFGDPNAEIDAYALQTGHPAWLARTLAIELGDVGARQFMAANESPAPLYLAHNPFLGSFEDLLAELALSGCVPRPCDVPGAVLCEDPVRAVDSEALRTGRAVVADLSAQAIIAATPLAPDWFVVDAAAGRGTKSILLQAAAHRAGFEIAVLSVDVHGFKSRVLRERAERIHVPDIRAIEADATSLDAMRSAIGDQEPDLVFVDAPCSGLGTLRRHPEKRWRVQPSDIDQTAELAQRILLTACDLVRPEGFVVYSTCTITARENVDVLSAATSAAAAPFDPVPMQELIAPSMGRWVTNEGYFQSFPELDGPDGHFAAIVQRG